MFKRNCVKLIKKRNPEGLEQLGLKRYEWVVEVSKLFKI